MNEAKEEKEIHRIFDLTLALKGVHALIEMAAGFLVAIMNPESVTRIVRFPYFIHLAQGFGGSARSFVAFYLVSHGIINGLIVAGLWKEKIWAYPVSFAVLGMFTAYQIYLLTFGWSLWLFMLTILDIAVILLIRHEYGVLKARKGSL